MKECFLEITVTNKCSCHCKYCFEKTRPESSREEELRQVALVKQFCDNFASSGFDQLTLIFWGGEPLNNTRFLYELIETAIPYPFVKFRIYTNGHEKEAWQDLMQQSWFADITRRLYVRISYDGDPIHKMLRGVESDNVMWLIDELRTRHVSFLHLMSTVSLEHVQYLEQSWDCFRHLRDKYEFAEFIPIIDTTADMDDTLDEFKPILHRLVLKEFDYIMTRGKYSMPICIWFAKDEGTKPVRNCVSDYFVNMHTDGKFYFCYGCNSFPWADKLALGDTKTVTDITQVAKKYDFGKINPECAICDAIFCFTCQSANIPNPSSFDEFLSKWHKNRNARHRRCKYYKMIGRMNRLLWKAVDAKNRSILEDENELAAVFGG